MAAAAPSDWAAQSNRPKGQEMMRAFSTSSTLISRLSIDLGASVPLWWARSSRPASKVSK
jgi:hypothetical protein